MNYIKKEILEGLNKLEPKVREFGLKVLERTKGWLIPKEKFAKAVEELYKTGGASINSDYQVNKMFKMGENAKKVGKMLRQDDFVEEKDAAKGADLKRKLMTELIPEIGGNKAFNRDKMKGEGKRITVVKMANRIKYENTAEFKGLDEVNDRPKISSEKRKFTIFKKGDKVANRIDEWLKQVNPKHKSRNFDLAPRTYKKRKKGSSKIEIDNSPESLRSRHEMWYNVYVNGVYVGIKVRYNALTGKAYMPIKDPLEYELKVYEE